MMPVLLILAIFLQLLGLIGRGSAWGEVLGAVLVRLPVGAIRVNGHEKVVT
jgi:hypothetical protein